MTNLVLSDRMYSCYAQMTILPPTFSISIEPCEDEKLGIKGFRICFSDNYRILKDIELFPMEQDAEFVNSSKCDADVFEKIGNSLLTKIMNDITQYIHLHRNKDALGDITDSLYFRLDQYKKSWQDSLDINIAFARNDTK